MELISKWAMENPVLTFILILVIIAAIVQISENLCCCNKDRSEDDSH